MSPGILIGMKVDSELSESLLDSPHHFLTPSSDLYNAALSNAKRFLDPLAVSTSHAQRARLDASRRKRKRGRHDDGEAERSVLQLKNIYIDGFTTDGIWGQARRILDASSAEIERELQNRDQTNGGGYDEAPQSQIKTVRFDEKGFEIDSNRDSESDEEDEDLASRNSAGEKGQDTTEIEDEDMEMDEKLDQYEEEDSGEYGSYDDEDPEQVNSSATFVKDKHGLNDGFFDIDDFNKESEFLEQSTRRGDDAIDSDEDEIDYFANPMNEPSSQKAALATGRKTHSLPRDAGVSGDEDEADGPTFGDADLNAPWSDDEDEHDNDVELDDDDDDDSGNANDVRYEDFFDPPSRPLMKTKRLRALPKTQPSEAADKPSAQDIQRTIDSVRRDLFEDEFSDADATDDEEGAEAEQGSGNLSTHERRKIALAKQIRELEAAAIEKRQWQLSGEASAHARPENALLEEDLEFERAGKPVPVITAEVSSSIEDMIKQRILNRQFDEVIKRHPGSEPGSTQQRRGLAELSDQKDPQSLAESYEQAYLARTDPNARDPRSEALRAQHAEIEKLWTEVSNKLDALTSWRYKPKPASVEVKIVTDAPRILMEDARPNGVEGVRGEESGLAPQEVFHVGGVENGKEDGVIVTKGGGVAAKEELTREQKLRRRRREKERMKKRASSGAVVSSNVKSDAVSTRTAKDGEAAILKQLKAGGVKVIGKGGQLHDVEGQKVKEKGKASAASLKF